MDVPGIIDNHNSRNLVMHRFTRMSRSAALRVLDPVVAPLMIGTVAQAALFQFADFHLINASQPLSLTNNAGTSATLQALNVPVVFNFTSQSTLPTLDRNAILTINP